MALPSTPWHEAYLRASRRDGRIVAYHYRFIVPGRPRGYSRTAGADRYNPQQYVFWREEILDAYYQFYDELWVPKFGKKRKIPTKWKHRLLVEAVYHRSDEAQAFDASNILKSVEDALQKHLWIDDSPRYIWDARCIVLFAEKDQYEGTHISVQSRDPKVLVNSFSGDRGIGVGRLFKEEHP